jgi:hypothetical protein
MSAKAGLGLNIYAYMYQVRRNFSSHGSR